MAKPYSLAAISEERLVSTGPSDMKTATVPKGTSAIYITVESTSCRMTFSNAGDPTTTTGLIVQKDQMPWFMPIGQGAYPRFASTAGTNSVIQIAYLS